jgi:protein-disulfide isomerase
MMISEMGMYLTNYHIYRLFSRLRQSSKVGYTDRMETQEQIQNEVSEVKKSPIISTPAAILTAGVIIALALIFSGKGLNTIKNKNTVNQQVPQTAPTTPVSIRENDYVRGDISKAEVTIVEYSDSDCPYCQKFHNTMKEVLKSYDTKVAWIYRYFPLSMHPNASNEAYATECAGELGGNDARWTYLDNAIDITMSPDKSAPILTKLATDLGIDAKLFATCLANPKTKAIVDEQSKEAQALGARGTPYSVAIGKNGKQVLIPGAMPIEQVKKIIDDLRK